MHGIHLGWGGVLGWTCAILLAALSREAMAEEPPLCELTIQGDAILSLRLEGENHAGRQFNRPGKTLRLPAGRYRVLQVDVEDGYVSNPRYRGDDGWFELTPERPYELAVGAPLLPTVSARREGRFLSMKYDLLDAAGRKYASPNVDRRSPPRFVVFKDDQEVGAGAFEYG